MTADRIQTGLRLESDLLQKITCISKREKRSLNAQIEFVVQCFVEQYEAENDVIPVDEES
jgi:hypothetical protein